MRKGIFISGTHNPYDNQSMETYLFNERKEYDLLLMIYINNPCVVIGRNQNPWKEINTQVAKEKNISVLRRVSGGGTVYHDLGNVNFSFIYNTGYSSVKENFSTVIKAIGSLGVELHLNARNDLCYDRYKISGNAFYKRGNRHMHHGTLLVNSDFTDLWQVLKFDKDAFTSQSIPSVKSEVMNLNLINDKVTIAKILEELSQVYQGESISVPMIHDQVYKAWDWIYGQTPLFTYKTHQNFTVKSGRVIKIDGETINEMKQFTLE